MRTRRVILTMLLAVLLVAAGVPATAGAKGGGGKHGGVQALGTSYAYDAYDLAGSGDGTPALARDITGLMPDYGSDRKEDHTFHSTTGAGDSDWLRFTVSADEVNIDDVEYTFRTKALVNNMDTVIEVYGPHATSAFSYTAANMSGSGDTTYCVGGDFRGCNDDTGWDPPAMAGPYFSTLIFRPPAAGTYYIRIRPYAEGDGTFSCEAADYDFFYKRGVIGREYGSDRVATAIDVSQWMFMPPATGPASRNQAVVLANKDNFPDALGGSLLAGMGDGPLLLTAQSGLSAGAGTEILRSGADTVYIVGGTGAVSDTVMGQVQSLSPTLTVQRVSGADRVKTAQAIVDQALADSAAWGESVSRLAIVAYSKNFPDALAASPLATARNVPILLTDKETLAPEAEAAMTAAGTTDVVIMGGTGVISQDIEDDLVATFGATHVMRFAGSNRYETAKLFSSWACDLVGPGTVDNGLIGTTATPGMISALDSHSFGIASGVTFADALPGGVACGHAEFPLLLNPKDWPYSYLMEEYDGALPPGDTDFLTDYFNVHPNEPFGQIVMFGGTGAIDAGTCLVLDNSIMQFQR